MSEQTAGWTQCEHVEDDRRCGLVAFTGHSHCPEHVSEDRLMSEQTACPTCEPDNPAARYADTCLVHRVERELPAHYMDCDRFQTYNYGTKEGVCDCTATADFEALLALAAPSVTAQPTEAHPHSCRCDACMSVNASEMDNQR